VTGDVQRVFASVSSLVDQQVGLILRRGDGMKTAEANRIYRSVQMDTTRKFRRARMCAVAWHGRFLFYIYSAKPKREKSTESVMATDTYCCVPSELPRPLNGAHTYAPKRNHRTRDQANGLVNWGQVFKPTSRQSSSTQAHAMTEGTICSLGCEG
jgi:hypothetical protein